MVFFADVGFPWSRVERGPAGFIGGRVSAAKATFGLVGRDGGVLVLYGDGLDIILEVFDIWMLLQRGLRQV